jgi:hypothetical protein
MTFTRVRVKPTATGYSTAIGKTFRAADWSTDSLGRTTNKLRVRVHHYDPKYEGSSPSCLIEDGNYADICVGERRKFALEFWASSPLIRSVENVYSSC